MEHLSHDNQILEDEMFARSFANALFKSGIKPDAELCERWLAEGYVNEEELEMILEAYEDWYVETE